MKRRGLIFGLLICALTLGAVGCKAKEEAPAETVSMTFTFANQTGKDVGILSIRPTEEYDWSSNLLQEEAWKNNFEVPVAFEGVLPQTENGWQVKMTFLDKEEEIWEGVSLTDGAVVQFSYYNGNPSVAVEVNETMEEEQE